MQYRHHRYQTQYPISVHTPIGPQQCRVVDVNNEGARLEGSCNLHRGDKVQLEFLSQRVHGVVCWINGRQFGLSFRPHLTNDQVDTLRYRSDNTHRHHRGTVGFGFVEM